MALFFLKQKSKFHKEKSDIIGGYDKCLVKNTYKNKVDYFSTWSYNQNNSILTYKGQRFAIDEIHNCPLGIVSFCSKAEKTIFFLSEKNNISNADNVKSLHKS
jgi:hypothetical protein